MKKIKNNSKIYVIIGWHRQSQEEVIVLRGYDTREHALKDECADNTLFFDETIYPDTNCTNNDFSNDTGVLGFIKNYLYTYCNGNSYEIVSMQLFRYDEKPKNKYKLVDEQEDIKPIYIESNIDATNFETIIIVADILNSCGEDTAEECAEEYPLYRDLILKYFDTYVDNAKIEIMQGIVEEEGYTWEEIGSGFVELEW